MDPSPHKVVPDTIVKVHSAYVHKTSTEVLNPSMLRTLKNIPIRELYITWTLHGYIGHLHRLWRSTPGTLDVVACTGPLFADYGAGPFASYDATTEWLNHKLYVSQQMKRMVGIISVIVRDLALRPYTRPHRGVPEQHYMGIQALAEIRIHSHRVQVGYLFHALIRNRILAEINEANW
ncbi:hypothetical protein BDR04DRAFT_1145624 [Suillus decipiens]|nr:hypothetical protein BDR04DRAFT_1145624 [Suillus decipiens]